jgi:hypothetical protein
MEPRKYGSSEEPRADGFEEDINDPRFAPYRYARSRAANTNAPPDESVPLFLSSLADQARQRAMEDAWENDRRNVAWGPEEDWERQEAWENDRREAKKVVSRRILKTGILAVAGAAAAFAFLSLEDRSGLVDKASASLAAILPTFSTAFGRSSAPAVETVATDRAPVADRTPPTAPARVTTAAPTREAIASAFQTALQSQPAPQAPPQPSQPDIKQPQAALAPAPPPPRRIDPDELTALLKRAKGLIDVGDIASARLLLERAASAREAKAALLLAQTYDPAVLGPADMRSITPDPVMARSWYQKAAELGSAEAQQRLAQMQN